MRLAEREEIWRPEMRQSPRLGAGSTVQEALQTRRRSEQVPVDGGLGWLAVAGAAYAANRLRKQRGAGGSEEEA